MNLVCAALAMVARTGLGAVLGLGTTQESPQQQLVDLATIAKSKSLLYH